MRLSSHSCRPSLASVSNLTPDLKGPGLRSRSRKRSVAAVHLDTKQVNLVPSRLASGAVPTPPIRHYPTSSLKSFWARWSFRHLGLRRRLPKAAFIPCRPRLPQPSQLQRRQHVAACRLCGHTKGSWSCEIRRHIRLGRGICCGVLQRKSISPLYGGSCTSLSCARLARSAWRDFLTLSLGCASMAPSWGGVHGASGTSHLSLSSLN